MPHIRLYVIKTRYIFTILALCTSDWAGGCGICALVDLHCALVGVHLGVGWCAGRAFGALVGVLVGVQLELCVGRVVLVRWKEGMYAHSTHLV